MVNAANIISHIHHTAGVSTGVGRSIRECAIEHARMASQRNALKSLRSNPESKPGNKITLPVLLVTCFLCCVAISLYGLAGMFGEKISRGGHSASNEVLEMVIANSVLNVPANLIRFSSQRRAGAHQRLELYMHWPSLSGYQDKLKESFSSANKQSNLLFLSLEPRSMSLDMSGRIGPIYSKFFNGVPSKGTAGLVRQPLKPEGVSLMRTFFMKQVAPTRSRQDACARDQPLQHRFAFATFTLGMI